MSYISVSRYIASENLAGVQGLARQLKWPVPQNANQAKNLLDSLYHQNQEKATQLFIDLHPDKELLSDNEYNNMIKEPLTKGTQSMHNAIGSDCGCNRNAMNDIPTAGDMRTYTDQTVNATKDLAATTYEKVKDMLREKDDQLFKRGAIFLGGVAVGAIIIKLLK